MARPPIFTRRAPPSGRRQAPEPDDLARLRREHAARVRRLEETILSLDNLLAPTDWLDAGGGFPGYGSWRVNRPATRTQDRTHAPLTYLNEEEWRQHVALARDLVTRNHLALGFRDHITGFVGPVQVAFVLRGQSPGSTSHGPRDADGDGEPDVDPLVKLCTQAWDEWCELAEWGQGEEDREEECRRRLLVEGEATLRFFAGDEGTNGLPHARHVEPELIRTPDGHSTADRYGWGVVTADGDDERELGLWVCDPADPGAGREVPVTEYVRVKANVDRTVKRGLSDLFPVGEHLRKVLGLLDNMAHVSRLQAAIAWWEQYPTATLDQVATQVRLGADYQRAKVPPTGTGASTDVTSYEPGTVVRTEGGREVRPGPVATGVGGFAQVEALVLRGVGFRWGCPSYFTGDGDASFASVLVTGSPFVRVTEARQERVKAFACRVATRVLEFCERSGRLPPGAARRVRPVATARPVVIADQEKKARTFLALYDKNCADPVEFIRSTGADPKVVAANIRAWRQKFPDTGPNGPLPAGGPAPAPPGSAGGDGTSPNANPIGEDRRLRENESGDGRKEGEIWQGQSGRWFVLRNGRPVPHEDPNKSTDDADADSSAEAGDEPDSPDEGAPDDPSDNKDDAASKRKVRLELDQLGSDQEKLAYIAKTKLVTATQVEAAGLVLLGPGATWQETVEKPKTPKTAKKSKTPKTAGATAPARRTPIGAGNDLRHDDGAIVRLIDMKTRVDRISIPDRGESRASKLGEVLVSTAEGKAAAPPKTVVHGYIHVGNEGSTFVTGYPGGKGEKSYKLASLKRKKGDTSGEIYPDLTSWKAAVAKRVASADDLDSPFPALQLSRDLTEDIGAWDAGKVSSARATLFDATKILNEMPGYHELIEKQARARIADDMKHLASANPVAFQGTMDLMSSYFQDPANKDFLKQVSDMNEIRNAVFENATANEIKASPAGQRLLADPNEITQAVTKMSDEHKAAVVAQAAAGLADEHKATFAEQVADAMSDEELARFARFVAERQRRRAGGPPTTS